VRSGGLGLEQSGEAVVEFGSFAHAQAGCGGLGGEGEIAGEKRSGREDIVEFRESGVGEHRVLHVAKALGGKPEMDFGSAELGDRERGGFTLLRSGEIGVARVAIAAGVEVGIAERLKIDGIAKSERGGAGETLQGFPGVAHADQADGGEEPGRGAVRIEAAGPFQVDERGSGAAMMLEFAESEFEEALRVGGIVGELLFDQGLIQIIFLLAVRCRIFRMAEMMDDEIGGGGTEAESGESFCHRLMHTSFVKDTGVVAKEAQGGDGNTGGKAASLFEDEGIGARRLPAEAGVTVAHVVPAPVFIGEHGGSVEQAAEAAGAGGVERLVGVEHQDPVAAAVGQDPVAGAGEVVFPGNGEEFGVKVTGDGGGRVGGTGIADHDAVDPRGDAREAAGEAGYSAVLHDHLHFEGRHRGERTLQGAQVRAREECEGFYRQVGEKVSGRVTSSSGRPCYAPSILRGREVRWVRQWRMAAVLAVAAVSAGAQTVAHATGTIHTPDVEIGYETFGAQGAALPVIAVNGGPGLSHAYMMVNDLWERIGRDRFVILYDQRGTGQSKKVAAGAAQTMDAQVADLEAVRAHFGIDKVALVGDSYGGFLVMAYGAAHPGHVAKMVLSDSPSPSLKAMVHLLPQVFPDILEEDEAAMKKAGGEESAAQRGLIDHFRMLFYSPEKRDAYMAKMGDLGFEPAVARAVSQSAAELDLTEAVKGFHFPVLVITGRWDMNVAPVNAWTMAHEIPGAKIEFFEKSGHLPAYEEAEKYQRVVEEFLDGQSAQRAGDR